MFKIEVTKSQGCCYCDKFKLVNNKTQEGYIEVFRYIKYYIDNLISKIINTYDFEIFIVDFEPVLFNSFNNIFNKHSKISHVGCYFHYINNIKKYLQKVGLTKKQNIETYERVINLF